MGVIRTQIKLANTFDVISARKGLITKEAIRQKDIVALVDTGCDTLAINEEICKELGLSIASVFPAELANGSVENVAMSEAVEVYFENRQTTCNAWVMPGSTEPLLGAIPIEGMDVVIDLANQVLAVNPKHPGQKVLLLK
ncbi:hypothetical protein FACS189419_00080 [Planctomycetales bacterium]|nr:hypothetical protein FACS189419_00080 [Planctomycetales bacterium]